ncbi:transcription elongation factor A N-terminal and central domain-containing protein 2-like [Mya arenaria]|uniref:transcription elongation factor A N-terminal and central domain-containing protein 2-like n=1 Tax=Mya arenaria TaxID=6604 RepID=UPI0022E67792|nr:transcription elongation factor A N-terminal and central domain-containing protein 2-like [Mya arenaria]
MSVYFSFAMDRFVVRNPPASAPSTSSNSKGKPRLKQTTIESLKGVVVVDEVLRHKSRLRLETTSKQEKLTSLVELGKKIPPRHIMQSTKIGNLIKKLAKSEDEDIRKAAKKVYIGWKTHFLEHMERPQIEVKCDLKTEKVRTSGKHLLAGALQLEETHQLPQTIERETFHDHRRLISHSYKRTIRNLVFILKHQEDMRSKVTSGEITVTDFVKEHKKS